MRALRSRSRARRGSIARRSRSARAARVWSWSRSRGISTCAVPRSCGIGSIASTSTTRTKTRTTAIPIPACTSTLAASPRTQRDTQQHTHPSTRRNMPRSTRPDTRANTRGPTVGHTRTPTSGSVRQSTNRGDSMRTVLIASALSLGALTSATAQDFNWHGRLAAGKRLEVKGVNGDVRAVLASGAEAVVNARKQARRSDPDEVKIEVVESDEGVTICAVYPTPSRARHENICEPGDHWSSSTDNNDVTVDFEVQVPAGIEFNGQTVNGEMSAEGLKGDVRASSVNGSVRVSTTGLAEASTVNGSVTAEMGRADWANDLEVSPVKGGVQLSLPGELDTDVRATTVNGDIEPDDPLLTSGQFGPRRLRGTIGAGGPGLSPSTGKGGIRFEEGPESFGSGNPRA